ncbi:hypothetical protein VCRA2118O41_80087 [Vibrio crassostreae]|nr:hypothetical protein VCRA2118O41_80087 [Vibrio crassostreae]CAK2375328.1 hypothetical protein VCRA2116O141_90091 [Vibrio crassostreae]
MIGKFALQKVIHESLILEFLKLIYVQLCFKNREILLIILSGSYASEKLYICYMDGMNF